MKYNKDKEWDGFKDGKQEKLNSMDFSQMKGLKEALGNKEVREWYKVHDEKIPSLIDTTKPIEVQARQAHELRNTYRIQARDLMKDQESRKGIDVKNPNQTFEELLKHKEIKYGLIGEDAFKDIVRSSQTTNKKYDKLAGIKE